MGMSSRTKPKETIPVLLDTNVLMYSASEPFEIRSQLERLGFKNIIVTEGVRRELERLAGSGHAKEKKFAKLSLEIAKKFETLPDPPIGGSVDDQLLYLSKECGYIVATSDTSLRRRLKREGLPVIYIKNRRLISECDLITKTNQPPTSTDLK
ncbi:MAG: hypothetical protein QXO76_10395 [Thermoproteota archaeon]